MATDADADLLAFFRSCEQAKPLRAIVLRYASVRRNFGADAMITSDAELTLYKQAVALAEETRKRVHKR